MEYSMVCLMKMVEEVQQKVLGKCSTSITIITTTTTTVASLLPMDSGPE